MPTDDEYKFIKSQRDLLFDGLKKLVRSDSTPDSIKVYLNQLGKKVVSLRTPASIAESRKAFSVGDVVMTTNNKVCRYKIEKLYEEGGKQFCTLRTIWVKDNIAPAEGIHNNVPLDLLKHYNGV